MNCPYCAEEIPDGVQKCTVCGEQLAGVADNPSPAGPGQPPRPRPRPQRNPQEAVDLAGAQSKAKNALIFGIVGLLCCGVIFGPLAIIHGKQANEVFRRYGKPSNGMATAGFVLGIIDVAFFVLGIVINLAASN